MLFSIHSIISPIHTGLVKTGQSGIKPLAIEGSSVAATAVRNTIGMCLKLSLDLISFATSIPLIPSFFASLIPL